MDAVTRLLSDLVAIPSVNPMGRNVRGPEFLETRLTTFLESYLAERGIGTRRDEILPGRANLIATFESPGSPRTILFDVHQDTVPVEGMTVDPFGASVAGGRLYGRGACDVKGSLAAMLLAFTRLHAERPKGAASVILAMTVDEEYTHVGSSRLAEQKPAVDLAVVAEPTRLDLVTCHKGAVRWKAVTSGVACHSSTPRLGKNAIYAMARVVAALEDHAAELDDDEPAPVLGAPTLSVGRIDGGQSVNVVPDRCEIEIDRRIIPGETADEARDRAIRFVASRLDPSIEIEHRPAWVRMPALRPTVPDAILDRLAGAIRAVSGRPPERRGVPFGTDGGPLGEVGIPCVVFGPGDIAQAHTKDEWIELDEVRQAAEIFYRIAVDLGA